MLKTNLTVHLMLAGFLVGSVPGTAHAQTESFVVGGGIDLMPQFYSDEVVKGAPVSATITTRTVQQLYDGNRIVHEDKTRLFRDSEGRVRREDTSSSATGSHRYSLSDPVSGQSFTVDEQSKTAFKVPAFPGLVQFGVVPIGETLPILPRGSTSPIGSDGPLSGTVAVGPHPGALPFAIAPAIGSEEVGSVVAFGEHSGTIRNLIASGPHAGARTEVKALGQQTIDGVRVEGTLHTTTYPAGALGNEKPIVVEKRSWFAPELRMMVRSEETDPRFGTINYETKIISTEEPDKILFVIPADFKVVEPDEMMFSPFTP